jgi:hypothetical protein
VNQIDATANAAKPESKTANYPGFLAPGIRVNHFALQSLPVKRLVLELRNDTLRGPWNDLIILLKSLRMRKRPGIVGELNPLDLLLRDACELLLVSTGLTHSEGYAASSFTESSASLMSRPRTCQSLEIALASADDSLALRLYASNVPQISNDRARPLRNEGWAKRKSVLEALLLIETTYAIGCTSLSSGTIMNAKYAKLQLQTLFRGQYRSNHGQGLQDMP